jgi:hypothetical protein
VKVEPSRSLMLEQQPILIGGDIIKICMDLEKKRFFLGMIEGWDWVLFEKSFSCYNNIIMI